MKAKKINEHVNWKGEWIPDKKDPFEKAGAYYHQKELLEELLKIVGKYRSILSTDDLIKVIKKLENNILIK